MCTGVVPGGRSGDCSVFRKMKVEVISCELCGLRANVYCLADGAYLCRECDGRVHGANFLAGRHVRCLLCNHCQKLTRRYVITNAPEATVNSDRVFRLSEASDSSKAAFETPFVFI